MVSVRIITADFYFCTPLSELDPTYSHFRGAAIKEVPVIRVFGTTQSGEKACVHIHGVLPYIYVPCPIQRSNSLMYDIAENLDKAINSSFGGSNMRKQHVFNISIVTGLPFYGYNSKKQDFYKIEFYQPYSIKKAVQLLQDGSICNIEFQPYEAHLPYILQFFIDYNLYGMNFLNSSKCSHRHSTTHDSSSGHLNSVTICQIEVDITSDSILNRHNLSRVVNPGLENIRSEEERRMIQDGITLSIQSDELRCYSPSLSDVTYREQLAQALEEKSRLEILSQSNGSSESQSIFTQELNTTPNVSAQVAWDDNDVSVLKVLFNRLVEDEAPDEDSVLGCWSGEVENPNNEDEAELEPEEDLSQPFTSFVEDSDEDLPIEAVSYPPLFRNNLSESFLWPEVEGLSQLVESDQDSPPPMYIDGGFDIESSSEDETPQKPHIHTPKKQPSQEKINQSPRYIPLDVKLHKSPKRSKQAEVDYVISSPEMFQEFEKRVAKLRKIKSPKIPNNVEQNNSERTTIMKKFETIEERDNDTNNAPSIPIQDKFDPLETDDFKIEDISMARKKLFQNDESSNDSTSINEGKDISSVLNSTNQLWEMSTKGSKSGSELFIAAEDEAYDNTLNSQNGITSFYADTTLAALQFNMGMCSGIFKPLKDPPSRNDVMNDMESLNLERAQAIVPFYSDPRDVPSGKEYSCGLSLKSRYPRDLEEFGGSFGPHLNDCQSTLAGDLLPRGEMCQRMLSSRRPVVLQPAKDPPHPVSIVASPSLLTQSTIPLTQESMIPATPDLNASALTILSQSSTEDGNIIMKKRVFRSVHKESDVLQKRRYSGEIDITPNNSGQFKMDFENLQVVQPPNNLHKFTTLMVAEAHMNTRGDLRPDPAHDGIQAIFYVIYNDIPLSMETSSTHCRSTGAVVICSQDEVLSWPYSCSLVAVQSEAELFSFFLGLMRRHDPDIIAGYEIEMLSWGYLIERGYHLGLNLISDYSRLKPVKLSSHKYEFSSGDCTELKIPGRIVLNIWRLMRHEVSLLSYTFESIMYHVLHTRVPKFSFKTLTHWWTNFSSKNRHLVMGYYLKMVEGVEKLLDQLDLIGRTGELASLFGIQFYEVLSRGSQFRVESMMLRLAKRFGYIAVSPSVQQRASMRAPASLPLIMEPMSRFYGDPVIVLDFQSLYPSMMIAYNYCFSTCLGRVSSLMESSDFKFGCTQLKVKLKELLKLKKNIHVSPAGVAFVDKSVRRGILPQMLEEILETRLMVKDSLKRHKSEKLLRRVLDARQLGLKLIANVTYGYTSANFSGRMPCIEVGDSVVSKGRETLERAIKLVENETKWRAKVVYGDTDSLFVHCPGRTRAEAFLIGQEIVDRVTAENPIPVKLKLEKVYQPCILQTKKRYVGMMYESPDQSVPTYDAKGIETVRRDGCPATSKILEKSLKLLFESGNMSKVKEYVNRQMAKVVSGKLSPGELVFAKEYRGSHGYQPTASVPALKIARDMVSRDKRSEPRRSERVPYVVVCGPPGLPLIALVRSLSAYLSDPTLVLNADYYVSKAILPPLNRCFALLGADVFSWYAGLPRKQLFQLQHLHMKGVKKATIAQYFTTVNCVLCGELTPHGLCEKCQAKPSSTVALLMQTVSKLERKFFTLNKICGSCCSRNFETGCISFDCPILFRRIQAEKDKLHADLLYNLTEELF